MRAIPSGWPASAKLAAHEAADRAEAVLSAHRATNADRAVFWKVWRQRIVWEGYRLEAAEVLDRKRLAEAAGVTERRVTTTVKRLREWGLIFWGTGAAHRWDSPLLVSPTYLARFRDFEGNGGGDVIHKVIHRSSTEGRTGNKISDSHYKDLPQGRTGPSEESLYSDPARSARSPSSPGNGNGQRPPRRARLRWSSGESLAAAALGRLGPPPPS